MPQVILFLDDCSARHDIMDAKHPDDLVIHAYTIDQFRKALEEHERFDIVSLDHDLNDFKGIQSLEFDGSESTGLDACGYLIKYKDKLPPEVMIHSSNGNGARRMMSFLKDKGIPFRWIMFGYELEGDDWECT